MGVFVARLGTSLLAMPPRFAARISRPCLREATSVNALSMVVRVPMANAPPVGWGDELKMAPNSMSLEPGGSVNFMPPLHSGPFSAIDEADCEWRRYSRRRCN